MGPLALIVGILAAAVAGLASYSFWRGLTDMLSVPTARTRSRIRTLGEGTHDLSSLPSGAALLLRAHLAIELGWRRTVAHALGRFAGVLDKAGVVLDETRLAQAGLTGLLSAQDMLAVRGWFAFVSGAGLGAVGLLSGIGNGLLFFALGLFLGIRLPSFTLGSLASTRSKECVRGLPEMIDMIALGSRAGLAFDGALAVYVERFDTPLAQEFGSALQKWEVGAATREEALEHLADSMNVGVVDRFVAAVLQAMKLGTPLAKTLEEQAREARKEQRLILEAEISKAPVKMFIPLGTLIMPAMLILLLGPVILQMMQSFSGG